MESTLNILPNFSIKKPYKLILYMALIVFFTSLFIPIIQFDVSILRARCLAIIAISMVAWTLLEIANKFIIPSIDEDEDLILKFVIILSFIIEYLSVFVNILIAVGKLSV